MSALPLVTALLEMATYLDRRLETRGTVMSGDAREVLYAHKFALMAATEKLLASVPENTLVDSPSPPDAEKPAFDLRAFGNRLRRACEDRRMLQAAAAVAMGVNTATLSRTINALQAPDVENYCRMLRWLESA